MGHTYMTSHTLDGYTKGIPVLISTDGPVTFFSGSVLLDVPVASSFPICSSCSYWDNNAAWGALSY